MPRLGTLDAHRPIANGLYNTNRKGIYPDSLSQDPKGGMLMNEQLETNNRKTVNPELRKTLLFLWIGMLILNGTYLRVRAPTALEADWLVWLRLIFALAGIVVSFFAILRRRQIGLNGIVLIAFLLSAVLSSLLSQYPMVVLGYAVLLGAAVLLTVALTQESESLEDLIRIETVWLVTVSLMLIKDFIIFSFLIPPQVEYGGTARIGLGYLHPNLIANIAIPAFWLVLLKIRFSRGLPLIVFFLYLVLAARARSAMLGLFIGTAFCLWYYQGRLALKGSTIRVLIPATVASVVLLALLLTAFEVPGTNAVARFIHRGQDAEMVRSLTGRAQIWPVVIHKAFDEIVTSVIGHGYGISRFVINDSQHELPFYADHAHNAMLEVLLAMGILGLLVFVVLTLLSIRWLFHFDSLRKVFSAKFALRAVCIMVAIHITGFTETYICTRVNPLPLLFFFYVAAIDQKKYLESVSTQDFVEE